VKHRTFSGRQDKNPNKQRNCACRNVNHNIDLMYHFFFAMMRRPRGVKKFLVTMDFSFVTRTFRHVMKASSAISSILPLKGNNEAF
jgi:hypothetical protein